MEPAMQERVLKMLYHACEVLEENTLNCYFLPKSSGKYIS